MTRESTPCCRAFFQWWVGLEGELWWHLDHSRGTGCEKNKEARFRRCWGRERRSPAIGRFKTCVFSAYAIVGAMPASDKRRFSALREARIDGNGGSKRPLVSAIKSEERQTTSSRDSLVELRRLSSSRRTRSRCDPLVREVTRTRSLVYNKSKLFRSLASRNLHKVEFSSTSKLVEPFRSA